MSTKINSRSPYFLTFTEPSQSLGTFACTGNKFMANPTGFEVNAYGVINEPVLQNGTIVGSSVTTFAENTTSSTISRTITYTIAIPNGYDNSGTITCDLTATQPVKAVATGGANCPTISSAISNITGLNGTQTIDLSTKFAAGAVAISNYNVRTIPTNSVISTSISGSTLTITGTATCQTATVYVTAQNATDACEVVDEFTVATTCVKALHCTTNDSSNVAVGYAGASFNSDGTFNGGTASITGIQPSAFVYNFTSHSDSYGAISSGTALAPVIPANTTGSVRNVYIKISWTIPSGFTNSGTLDCTYTIEQASATSLKSFTCDNLTNVRILPNGTVDVPFVTQGGTHISTTLTNPSSSNSNRFDANNTTSNINRTVTFNIRLSAGFTVTIDGVTHTEASTAGSNLAPCTQVIEQPPMPSSFSCGTNNFFITRIGFNNPTDVCNNNIAWTFGVNIAAVSTLSASFVSGHLGASICVGAQRFSGNNLWYGADVVSGTTIGNTGAPFKMVQIDSNGKIIAQTTATCQTNIYTQNAYPSYP